MDGTDRLRTVVLRPWGHGEPEQGAATRPLGGSYQYREAVVESDPAVFLYLCVCVTPRAPAAGLLGTEMAHAQCGTIRLRVLKIGARITISGRRIWGSMASGYAYALLFQQVCTQLRC
jgi:Transposase DDE domain group 1